MKPSHEIKVPSTNIGICETHGSSHSAKVEAKLETTRDLLEVRTRERNEARAALQRIVEFTTCGIATNYVEPVKQIARAVLRSEREK